MSDGTSYWPRFVDDFLGRLESDPGAVSEGSRGLPAYRFDDASERALLATRCRPVSFRLGTGASLFTDCLIPAMVSARSEIILVTCFWAPSESLTALHDALTALAAHRRSLIRGALSRGDAAIRPLTVRICLSSRSLLQKLLHPQSRGGYMYPPSAWEKQLGLPDPASLEAGGIQLQVKSLFFLPFSVMHPKFVIIDRQRAFVPSCNQVEPAPEGAATATEGMPLDARHAGLVVIQSPAHHRTALRCHEPVPTLVLPSSHHANPRFRPFPWQKPAAPPSTPQNIALLQLFSRAQQSIYIQTPNMTCRAVIAAVLDALARGVHVSIVTNRSMMLAEQLLTAGTTTSWCMWSLVRRFRRLRATADARSAGDGGGGGDLEAGRPSIGRLQISYFRAKSRGGRELRETPQSLIRTPSRGEEPVHSHLKLTLVDDTYAVLGSANMDRASWFTSQELSLLFHDRDLCTEIRSGIDSVLDGRVDLVFDSDDDVRAM
ncbi:a45145ec-6e2a-43bb-aa81-45692bb8f707 [Thermothielavioides terrestris]|uniref:A45145ec-6e2a-43bb-aa81-45692bb8f707 n=1 Tax=Thermothielavioides terrestris TaxID=2587410 RepID=A0A3S5CXJ3_9PEZI|nr:a45145ec-6e2a-43bb-aa81-45692bb8f707 [Thermothielavioides terrestris]